MRSFQSSYARSQTGRSEKGILGRLMLAMVLCGLLASVVAVLAFSANSARGAATLPPNFARSQVVGGLVVVGVADHGDRLARVEAGDRLHGLAGRDVELVGALEHVGPGGHHVAAVVTGLLEALADLLGDRRGGLRRLGDQEPRGRRANGRAREDRLWRAGRRNEPAHQTAA